MSKQKPVDLAKHIEAIKAIQETHDEQLDAETIEEILLDLLQSTIRLQNQMKMIQEQA
jgi:hypothetical protein